MLCIVQETFSYRSTNGLQTLVFGLFETFDIIQLIGQMSQIEASSFISWALGTFAVPEEGNLRIRVFRGKGKSIPTHGGIFFFFVANWLRSKRCTQIKLCAVFEGIFIYLFIYLFLWFLLWIHGDVVFTIKSIPCDDLIDMSVKSSERPWMYGTQ